MIPGCIGLLLSGLALAQPAPPDKMLKMVSKRECNKQPFTAVHISTQTVNRVDFSSWEIKDCGDPFMLTWAAAGGTWSFTTDKPLRSKAPFDLDCPADQVEYKFIDGATRGVSGCGRRATYMSTPNGWVANVTSE